MMKGIAMTVRRLGRPLGSAARRRGSSRGRVLVGGWLRLGIGPVAGAEVFRAQEQRAEDERHHERGRHGDRLCLDVEAALPDGPEIDHEGADDRHRQREVAKPHPPHRRERHAGKPDRREEPPEVEAQLVLSVEELAARPDAEGLGHRDGVAQLRVGSRDLADRIAELPDLGQQRDGDHQQDDAGGDQDGHRLSQGGPHVAELAPTPPRDQLGQGPEAEGGGRPEHAGIAVGAEETGAEGAERQDQGEAPLALARDRPQDQDEGQQP